MSFSRSWTAVTSSPGIIRYEPSPTRTYDLSLRGRQLDADAAGDLVAHARVAVLDVVALRVARAPELVQVARHRPRRADDDASRRRRVVDRADHLALRRQRGVAQPVQARHLCVPLHVQARGLGAVGVVDGAGPRAPSRAARGRRARRRRGGCPPCFAVSKLGDVDVDEADAGILEGRLRRSREVAVARADRRSPGRLPPRTGSPRTCRSPRSHRGWTDGRTAASPCPAWVSPTGMPVASQKARSASVASE